MIFVHVMFVSDKNQRGFNYRLKSTGYFCLGVIVSTPFCESFCGSRLAYSGVVSMAVKCTLLFRKCFLNVSGAARAKSLRELNKKFLVF